MQIKRRIFTIGEKNVNGLIYTKEMAYSIINIFKKYGYLFGKNGSFGNDINQKISGMPITEITHKVIDVDFDGKHFEAVMETLDTPIGKEFEKYYKENKENIIFKPEGTGKVDKQSDKIFDYNIIGINAINKKDR